MQINIGPFHFGFGKQKQQMKQQNIQNKQTIQSSQELTADDMANVCDQVGAFDGMNISEQQKQAIWADLADRLNESNFTTEQEITSIIADVFVAHGIMISAHTASLWAGAYLESYLYD